MVSRFMDYDSLSPMVIVRVFNVNVLRAVRHVQSDAG